MNLKSIVAVIVAVLAGTIGGAAAYTVATPSASAPAPTSTSIQPAADTQDVAAAPVEKVVKLRPCRKPAERVGKKCVTDVTRTVVVPGSARSSAPAAPGTSVPGDDPTTGSDDDSDEAEDHGTPGTGSDDQGDDDQYGDETDQGDDDSGDDETDDQSDDQDEPGDDETETESPEVED